MSLLWLNIMILFIWNTILTILIVIISDKGVV